MLIGMSCLEYNVSKLSTTIVGIGEKEKNFMGHNVVILRWKTLAGQLQPHLLRQSQSSFHVEIDPCHCISFFNTSVLERLRNDGP